MVNRLRRTDNLPLAYGHTVGMVVGQTDNRLKLNISGTAGDTRYVELDGGGATSRTAAFTLAAKDAGLINNMDAAASVIATLPLAASCPGATFKFYVAQLPTTGAGVAVSPAASNMIIGNGFTGALDKDAICSAISDRVGDYIEVTSLGGTTYLITQALGTWAREA